MGTVLPDERQRELRQENFIQENEIAILIGGLYIAENVLTGERRLIQNKINENSRRILKG